MAASKHPLSIRFMGSEFETRGVPINDLGQSLITIQRMVNIAYLVNQERAFVRASLRNAERQALALQIAGRERKSDAYLLDWFVRDVVAGITANVVADTLLLLAGASIPYIKQGITDIIPKLVTKRPKTKKAKVDLLAVRMYTEFQELTNQIGSQGGIESIEIRFIGHKEPIIIDEEVKQYVNNIAGMEVPGRQDDYIVGEVDKAHTLTRDCVEINMEQPQIKRTKRVKVCMPGPQFENLLNWLTDPNMKRFGFSGQARYTIGSSLNWFNKFDAEEVQPAALN